MLTVGELSEPYALFMRNPQPPAGDVCEMCRTFTNGYSTCYKCEFTARYADLVVPISYSEHFGQLHTILSAYKRAPEVVARPLRMQLAAVLWRFLVGHEACLAHAAGVSRFDLVTTVPSGIAHRDGGHPLRRIGTDVVQPTRGRRRR